MQFFTQNSRSRKRQYLEGLVKSEMGKAEFSNLKIRKAMAIISMLLYIDIKSFSVEVVGLYLSIPHESGLRANREGLAKQKNIYSQGRSGKGGRVCIIKQL